VGKKYKSKFTGIEKKKHVAIIEECNKVCENDVDAGFWWDESIDDMVLEELEVCVRAMQDLKKNVATRINWGNDHFGNQNMVHFDVGGVNGFSLELRWASDGGRVLNF